MQRTVIAPEGRIEYELVRTGRRDMEIQVLSGGNVRLFAPARASLRAADGFVRAHAGWIESARAAMREYARAHEKAHPMRDGASILLEGRPLTLRVTCPPPGAREGVEFTRDEARVYARDAAPDSVRALLGKALAERARARIGERLDHYVPLVGRAPGRVSIRDQKTRWGSCSSAHNVNFNWKLIMAPPEALDYVVIHELCHLYEFNHSDRFWARVARYQSDWAVWKKWLKDNGRLLGV